MGAAGSLPACKDPNVELTFGVLVGKFGSPSLSNTETLIVGVAIMLIFVDVASVDDSALSLFSCDEDGMGVTEEVVVLVASDVFSSDFDRPKVKPTLELLSVLDDPAPNTIPPLTPNLKPDPAAGWSDFLSSLESAPNLKPSEELPNLNPDEAVVSLEDSDEEFPNGTPNLNPPDTEVDDSEDEVPNLNPPDPDVLSDVPNLKPPKEEVDEPKPDDPEVPAADDPKVEPKALGSMLAPGLAA